MASQICPLCHQEAPSTARFCPNCAASLGQDVPPPQAPQPFGMASAPITSRTPTHLDTVAWKSQRILIAALVLGLIVIGTIAAVSMRQNSLLTAEHSKLPAPPVMGAAQPPILAGPSVVAGAKTPLPSGSPVTGAEQKPGVAVPPEVLDYLDFLGKIEARRVALKNNLNAALPMLGAAKSMEGATENDQQQGAKSQINSGYSDYTAQWQQLMRDFQAKPAPQECQELGNDYYRLLNDYSSYISQIQVAMQNKDLNTLMSLQGSAQTQVNTDATTADTALADLCQRYDMQKPFNISPDSSGSGPSVLGM